MSEKALSSFAATSASASLVFVLLGLLMIFGGVSSAAGEYNFVSSFLFWKGMVLFIAYALSQYMLVTLDGKNRRRRLASWIFSIVLHAAVITYVAFILNSIRGAVVLLVPELAVVLLSIGGLVFASRACA